MVLRPPSALLGLFTYRQLYAITISLSCFILCLLTALLSCLCSILIRKLSSRIPDPPEEIKRSPNLPQRTELAQFPQHAVPEITRKSRSPYQTFDDNEGLLNEKKTYPCLTGLNSVLSWLSCLYLVGIPVSFSAFGFLPIWLSIIFGILIFSLRLTKTFRKKCAEQIGAQLKGCKRFKEPWAKMIKYSPKFVIVSLFLVIVMALLMSLSTYKSCINDHIQGYGIPWGNFIYSSALTRFITLPDVCPGDAPCHIYATVPFETSSSVFINVHTGSHVNSITVNYDTVENFEDKGTFAYTQGSSYTLTPNYDITGERNIHSVLLTDLKPDQVYALEIFYNGKSQAIRRYQTLPDENSDKKYTLIYGGDIGYSKTSETMARVVAAKQPRALIIGGDIAYDDGDISCYYGMDLFLWMMEKEIFDQVGRLVPMMLALGNHDIGFSSLNGARMPINEDGPSFYINFPQNLPVQGKGVPSVEERSAHRAHKIGNILNIFLDSGYQTDYKGDQLEWLKNVSLQHKNSPKVAIYHDPIFSPCYSYDEDYNATDLGITNWASLFTEHKYMAVFENHAHIYKKTFPLNGLEKAKNGIGTLYLGDGSWGPSGYCQNGNALVSDQDIYEGYAAVNNIWSVEIDPKNFKISYDPIGLDNKAIDHPATQNITHYVDL